MKKEKPHASMYKAQRYLTTIPTTPVQSSEVEKKIRKGIFRKIDELYHVAYTAQNVRYMYIPDFD